MKTIFTIIYSAFFLSGFSFGEETHNLNRISKAKTVTGAQNPIVKTDSVANYSISINGERNMVNVKTDSLTVQTSESINKNQKADNTITIIGKGNSVAVTQGDEKGKVTITQNGNNNKVSITQSTHKL